MPIKPTSKPALYNIAKNISGQWSGNNDTFYHSNRWRTLRKAVLTSNPLCVHCNNNGLVTLAKVADHIQSVRLGGDKWNIDNLQGLCESCHNIKTSKESKQWIQ
jgi:5-methylcytosine-specific restriction protein A